MSGQKIDAPFGGSSMAYRSAHFVGWVSLGINLPGWKTLRMTIERRIMEPSNPTVKWVVRGYRGIWGSSTD
jgi:hypothetical protein